MCWLSWRTRLPASSCEVVMNADQVDRFRSQFCLLVECEDVRGNAPRRAKCRAVAPLAPIRLDGCRLGQAGHHCGTFRVLVHQTDFADDHVALRVTLNSKCCAGERTQYSGAPHLRVEQEQVRRHLLPVQDRAVLTERRDIQVHDVGQCRGVVSNDLVRPDEPVKASQDQGCPPAYTSLPKAPHLRCMQLPSRRAVSSLLTRLWHYFLHRRWLRCR